MSLLLLFNPSSGSLWRLNCQKRMSSGVLFIHYNDIVKREIRSHTKISRRHVILTRDNTLAKIVSPHFQPTEKERHHSRLSPPHRLRSSELLKRSVISRKRCQKAAKMENDKGDLVDLSVPSQSQLRRAKFLS